MAADRDARVLAMLEEMRLKGGPVRGNVHSLEEQGKRRPLGCCSSSSSSSSLEQEVEMDHRVGLEGNMFNGDWYDPGRASLGRWGRRRVKLRRSISADSLAGSLLHLDSGISVCDWGAGLFTCCPSEVGGVKPEADSSDCDLSITSSSSDVTADTRAATSNDDTLTQDTVADLSGEMGGEFPVDHVIPKLGGVWCGPGVKKSQSVTERLQHGSVRAASLRNDLLALLGQAETEDDNLQETAVDLVAVRLCGDAEQEAEGERQLLLSRERREAALSKAEAMAACNSREQDGTTSGACTATVTISNICVTVSPANTLGVSSGGNPLRCSVRDSFLCLVRDTVDGSVAATEVEQLTAAPEGGSRELVFHSTMRWVEQCPDFKLRVELYHLPAAPLPKSLDHSPAQRWRVPNLLNRALSSSPFKALKRKSSKRGGKGLSRERTSCTEQDNGSGVSSRFTPIGHVEVNGDSREGHVLAHLGPRFQIEFDVSFEPEWEEDCALEGFLTVQRGLGWDILWCLLQGHYLYFWHYPEEVGQNKMPVHHADLCHCHELAIPAPREVCVRRNAIQLSMSDGASLLLVAESRAEQGRWIAALNRVIMGALAWKQT